MRVLVTGGAGYIGSHCVRALLAAGHEPVVLDNLCFGHRSAVSGCRLLEVDLLDAGGVEAAVREVRPEAVMHFAAFLFVGESVSEPLKYYRNNVIGSIHLLEAMQRSGVRNLVFSSTCATYGQPERLPITEQTPQQPINPYGASKLMVERILQDSAAAWGLGSTALRYFNVAGASADGSIGEDHEPEIHLIPRVLFALCGRLGHIDLYGEDYPTPDGTCIRDYIHVEDLARAHVLALEANKEGRFEAYNVGTGRGTSVREIIAAAEAVTGRPCPVRVGPRRAGDPAELWADPSKLKGALGWEPRYAKIEDIVRTAWQWHERHPEGYGDRP